MGINLPKKIWMSVALFAFVVGVGFSWWTTRPSYALFRVAVSLVTKSKPAFWKFVDVDRVAEGLADDAVSKTLVSLGNDPAQASSLGGDSGDLGSLLKTSLVQSLKPQMKGFAVRTIETFFEKEPLVNSSGESLNSVILMVLSLQSDLQYDWRTTGDGDERVIVWKVGFQNQKTHKPFDLSVKMEKVEGAWRVTRLMNILDLMVSPYEKPI